MTELRDEHLEVISRNKALAYTKDNSDKLLKKLKTDNDNINIMRANQLRKKIIKVDEFNEII